MAQMASSARWVRAAPFATWSLLVGLGRPISSYPEGGDEIAEHSRARGT